jgi:hypothetical protein
MERWCHAEMTPNEIIDSVADLPPKERAAAIAHGVYMLAAQASAEWDPRVSESWSDLTEEARAYNLASIEVWAAQPALTDAWIAAIGELRGG